MGWYKASRAFNDITDGAKHTEVVSKTDAPEM